MCAEKDFGALELAGCLQIHHNLLINELQVVKKFVFVILNSTRWHQKLS